MNNKNIPLTYSELELLEVLNQRYEMLASVSGKIPAENFSFDEEPVTLLNYNNAVVKHRLEVFFGLNKSDSQ